jgi:hypothetical protein
MNWLYYMKLANFKQVKNRIKLKLTKTYFMLSYNI